MLGRAGPSIHAQRHALTWLVGAVLALALLLAPGLAWAQTFPALSGRVVDAANVIPAETEARLNQKLEALQAQSQRQLVVATVPSLEGYEISDYANRMFRTWRLGDKARNDGVLLLIAVGDRKMRIEVGYGMEGIVTDGLSFLIINQAILPKFKAGDLPGGIEAGTDALIKQISLPEDQARQIAAQSQVEPKTNEGVNAGTVLWLIFFFLFFVLPMLRRLGGGRRYQSSGLGQVIMWSVLDGMTRGGGGGGSSWGGGGGGFSGGGGSSGGGGASGSW